MPRIRFTCAFLALAFGLFPEITTADQNIACVQKQLLEEGLNPGPADGILGSKTRSALNTFRKSHESIKKLPKITDANASVYCRSIGLARDSLTGWSSAEGLTRLILGKTILSFRVKKIQKIIDELEGFFLDDLAVTVPQKVNLIITNSVTEAAKLAVAELRVQGTHSDITDSYEAWCRGYGFCGVSYGGVVAANYTKSRGFPESDMRRLFAHELAHEIHTQYVGNFRARGEERRVHNRGPKWLTEAFAEAIALGFAQPDLDLGTQLKKFSIRRDYSSKRLKSFRNQTSADQQDFYDYSTYAGLLIQSRSSLSAIIDFWEITPSLGWKKAFQNSFGFSVTEFYEDFDSLE